MRCKPSWETLWSIHADFEKTKNDLRNLAEQEGLTRSISKIERLSDQGWMGKSITTRKGRRR